VAHIIEDRVMETSTTTGTGNFTLAGAVTGFVDFDSVMANADTCYYLIEAVDGNGVPTGSWETGFGTFNDTDTLVRTTVIRSSNANAAVNFAAGTKRVSLTQSSRAFGEGSAFPSSPRTNERFLRTDRNIWYYYTGSQWLSDQILSIQLGVQGSTGASADGNHGRAAVPYFGVYTLYLESMDISSFVSATAIWNLNLNYVNSANAATLIATQSTSGDAANTWMARRVSIAAALSSNARVLELFFDETTGTATLFANATVWFRLVG
jgi:hypothetical protein